MANNATKPSAVVTTELNTPVFSEQDTAALVGAAAGVAEQDQTEEKAVETYVRVLGKAPTLMMYTAAQALFQQGYHAVAPDLSVDALAKRTSRFFSEVLKAGNITKPKAETVTATKKAAQREEQKKAMLADPTPLAEISNKIKAAYAALANDTAADPAATRKELKALEKLKSIKTNAAQAETKDKAKEIRDSLIAAARACTDIDKLSAALIALK